VVFDAIGGRPGQGQPNWCLSTRPAGCRQAQTDEETGPRCGASSTGWRLSAAVESLWCLMPARSELACARRWPSRPPPASPGVVLTKSTGAGGPPRRRGPGGGPRKPVWPYSALLAPAKALVICGVQQLSNSLKAAAGDLEPPGERSSLRAPNKPCLTCATQGVSPVEPRRRRPRSATPGRLGRIPRSRQRASMRQLLESLSRETKSRQTRNSLLACFALRSFNNLEIGFLELGATVERSLGEQAAALLWCRSMPNGRLWKEGSSGLGRAERQHDCCDKLISLADSAKGPSLPANQPPGKERQEGSRGPAGFASQTSGCCWVRPRCSGTSFSWARQPTRGTAVPVFGSSPGPLSWIGQPSGRHIQLVGRPHRCGHRE